MVEHSAVNRQVARSSRARGAKKKDRNLPVFFIFNL